MINILIVEKDMNYCKEIINLIGLTSKTIRIFSIVSTITEINEILSMNLIDIIIINFTIFETLDIKKILESRIDKKSIIWLSNNDNNKSLNIFLKNNFNGIINKIRELSYYNNKFELENLSIKNKITHELNYLGYNLTHTGTKYLIETIFYLYTINDFADENLEKNVYPIIAKKYNKTPHNIKCNIINATNSMFYDCKEDVLLEYLDIFEIYKPGPKKIICAVLNKIATPLYS